MSKRQLATIIERENMFRKWREEKPMDIDNLSKEDADSLYQSIDCGLSPENLHCDGEISRAQAQAKYNNYMGAVRELQKRGFDIPKDCWEIGA
mgnify:CR=1 FL=1